MTKHGEDGHVHGPHCNHGHDHHEHAKPVPFRAAERPGRNEPCWCGSGKKYKKCHWQADEMGGSAST